MGFSLGPAATEAAAGSMLVAAEVSDAAGTEAAVGAGARALVFVGDRDSLAAVVETAGAHPVGMRIDAATAEDSEALVGAGADFLIFDSAQTTATALLERGLGSVLVAPAGRSDDELRRFGPLDLDGVLVGAQAGELSVMGQLELRHLAEFARAPLVIVSDATVPASTLEVWRDAGAGVVVLTLAAAGDIAALVAAAAEVRPPRDREEDRAQPLLPAQSVAHEHDFDEDD